VFKYEWIDLFVLAGLAWIGISLVFSEYAYATISEGIKVLSYIALWYLGRVIVSSQKTRSLLLFAIVGSGSLQFCVALYNWFVQHTPGWKAGFVNPNEFACFLVIGLHIALSFLLFQPQTTHDSTTQKVLYFSRQHTWRTVFMLAAMSISGYLLIVLQSRGALLSFAVTVFVLATLRHKYAGLVFIGILTCVIIFPFPQGSLLQRLSKRDDPFAYQRFDIWKSSLRMLADHPLNGVGLGMYPYYGAAYNFPVEHRIARYGKRLDLAHSDLFHIGAELGLIGLLLFLGGLARLAILGFRHLRRPPRSWHVVAASAGLLGVILNGLVSNLLLSPALAMTSILLASILLESTGTYTQKIWTINESKSSIWKYYGGLALCTLYLLVPVIGYPFLAHAHFLKFQQYRKNGQLPEAVAHLHKAIDYVPLQAYYHHAFGQLYTTAFRNQPNLDAFYEGYKSLTQAIRHNPRESQFYMTLADLHRTMFRQKLPTRPTAENALREYEHALAVDPFNPFILAEMATLYAEIGEFEQAIKTIQEAIEHEPNFVRGHQLLGEFYHHLNREADAQEAFARAETIRQTYPSYDYGSEYTQALLRPL
jgi:O-antigen ligase